MDFKVSSTTIDGTGVLLVSVEGELDIGSAEELVGPTEVAVSAACPLILDLSQCPFIDSSGLRLMLHANHALSDVGARLAVVTDRPQAKRLLSVTGTDQRVPLFESLSEAIAWLAADAAEGLDVEAPATAVTNGRPPAPSPLP